MLAFYDYNYSFVELLIRAVERSGISMLHGGKIISNANSIHRIINDCNGDVWYLARSFAKIENKRYEKFQYAHFESISGIDSVINEMSADYDWVVFPWGIHHDFRGIGIVSKERIFAEIDDIAIVSEMDKYLISEYQSCNKTSFHSLLASEEPEHIGKLLWQVYDLERIPPIIATCDILSKEILVDSEDSICVSDYEKIDEISVSQSTVYHLYRPQNYASFHKICKLFYGYIEFDDEPSTVIAFPYNAELELVKRFIQQTHLSNRSICSFQKEIISMFQWLYMVDVGDSQTWTVSRDSSEIREIGKIDCSKVDQLLAF